MQNLSDDFMPQPLLGAADWQAVDSGIQHYLHHHLLLRQPGTKWIWAPNHRPQLPKWKGGTPSAQHATLVHYKWSRDDAANYLSDSGLLSILVSVVYIVTVVKLQPYADLRNNLQQKQQRTNRFARKCANLFRSTLESALSRVQSRK